VRPLRSRFFANVRSRDAGAGSQNDDFGIPDTVDQSIGINLELTDQRISALGNDATALRKLGERVGGGEQALKKSHRGLTRFLS
jgi:hypothetical protein